MSQAFGISAHFSLLIPVPNIFCLKKVVSDKLEVAACEMETLRLTLEGIKRDKEEASEQSQRALVAMQNNMKRSLALQQAQAERIKQLEEQQQVASPILSSLPCKMCKMAPRHLADDSS